MSKVIVKFTRSNGPYNANEVAGFDAPVAERLIAQGYAVLFGATQPSAAELPAPPPAPPAPADGTPDAAAPDAAQQPAVADNATAAPKKRK